MFEILDKIPLIIVQALITAPYTISHLLFDEAPLSYFGLIAFHSSRLSLD